VVDDATDSIVVGAPRQTPPGSSGFGAAYIFTRSGGAWTQQAQPEAVGLDIPSIHAEALAADQSGFFGRKKRRRAAAARLATVLRSPDTIDLKQLSILTGQIAESAAHIQSLRAYAQQLAGVRISTDWNPLRSSDVESVTAQIAWLRWVVILWGSSRRFGRLPGHRPGGRGRA